MFSPAISAGGMLAKRAVTYYAGNGVTANGDPVFTISYAGSTDGPQQPQPPIKWPAYGGLQMLFNFILFTPIFVYVLYTLSHVYPTLAMVEDPLPDYDAIPINDNNDDDNNINKANNTSGEQVLRTKPITASLRATHRTLQSISGWRSQFRGLGCALFLGFVWTSLSGLFSFIPILGNLAVMLLTSQLYTALTHIIITQPLPADSTSGRTFWSRLPNWRRNLVATYQPILFYWGAANLAVILPGLLAILIGLVPSELFNNPPSQELVAPTIAKIICVSGVFLGLVLLMVVPAHVALIRVQASLLRPEEETIIPFDRTFGGSVEPEVINGRGFTTVKHALRTVSWASWVRLYVQQIKIMGVTMVIYMFVLAVLSLEYFFLGWRK